jgi:uncharacterized protein YhaN
MKILEIHIYGFGKLENVSVTALQDFQVFYGENEAGKSTIMAFIHSVLFGFPTKQQSELRYEPKTGSKYGGQLVLAFEEKGKVVIERVRGKAAGDVTVLLEDGSTGGEEMLKELLSHIDKTLYQSIFSFNLHGLQNVHNLKSEDLGKFLFSTGTVGSDSLLLVENQLQKEIDNRYKPSGKKPYINEKLKKVREVYNDLKKAELKNDQYGALKEQKEELERNIQTKQEEIQNLQKEIQELEEWDKLSPLVKERRLLQAQLENIDITFPVDGITRLEQLQMHLKPLEGHLLTLTTQRDKLKEELERNRPNQEFLNNEANIQSVLERLPLYETMKEEIGEWQIKSQHLRLEIEEIKEQLHFPIDDAKLLQLNTSIFMKEQTAEAEKLQVKLKEQKQELDEQFKVEKEELERLEVQMEQLREDILPKEKREEKQKKLQGWVNKESIERELRGVQDKLHLIETNKKKEKEQARQNQYQSLFLGLLFVLLTVWGILQSQWLLAIIGGFGLGFILFMVSKKHKSNIQDSEKELQKLKQQEINLTDELKALSMSDFALIEEQLRRDTALQEQLSILSLKWEQQNSLYERIIQAYETWERDAIEHEKLLEQLGEELSIPDTIAKKHIHGAYNLISKLKDTVRDYVNMETQLKKKLSKIENIEDEIDGLSRAYLEDKHMPLRDKAFLLREELKKEKIKQQKYQSQLEKFEEIQEQIEKDTQEHQHLSKEQERLFQLADVNTEEEFREAGKIAAKREKLMLTIEELSRSIALSSLEEDKILILEKSDPILAKERVAALLNQAISKNKELQQSLADIKHQIALLEEGGVYGDLLHKYKQLQSELDIEAKEWAKLSIAKAFLTNTVNRFKEEHLPSMLRKADQFLSFLTDENYIRMLPKSESTGFLIERKDHILFDANELSQATMEQVYVSLRLALATTIYKRFHFPIIIDDSFVNFDHVRTKKVIECLQNEKDNQFLFFTCHNHLLAYFKEEQIIEMKKVNSAQKEFQPAE